MSITHILNTIDQKAKAEAEKIIATTKAEAKLITEQAQEHIKAIKEKSIAAVEQKTSEKIKQAKRQAAASVRNKLTEKKREVLESVYEKAVKKLAKQHDSLRALYKNLLIGLPENAVIAASPESAAIITALVPHIRIISSLQEEGFIVKSKSIEIDNRISRLIKEVQDEAEIEVAKLLFNTHR